MQEIASHSLLFTYLEYDMNEMKLLNVAVILSN